MLNSLSRTEWRCLQVAFAAPCLWRFALVVAELGVEAAVEACRTPSPRVREILEAAGYDPVLPPHGDMRYLITACRIRAGRKPKETVQGAAHRLGIAQDDAPRGVITSRR